ncbi:hypothetical protein JCM17846_13130 [Iodidimonas nitroreducens]|uniref:Uncharacterized protein n=1 Tax=Iodidimonas nitroreducens TaxID=1236968 RepID=A0A5A7N5Q2_9PROT|nr:hypothetical protein JCM17846_13130 [Iodidimonas nitroreducens]
MDGGEQGEIEITPQNGDQAEAIDRAMDHRRFDQGHNQQKQSPWGQPVKTMGSPNKGDDGGHKCQPRASPSSITGPRQPMAARK